ncbi:hypothetical protein KIN20_030967 [Parelaphostrongylus tenuis]|uniref:Uncharacterized protein n=1 Tax=Parelaphostrongylus tenuis TaxID=148309 RepID=A0AAD5R4G8_PARTN|nr:hypothetical protein KIN20_030967 [Parelaphostrongylus tenuis]
MEMTDYQIDAEFHNNRGDHRNANQQKEDTARLTLNVVIRICNGKHVEFRNDNAALIVISRMELQRERSVTE